MGCAHEPVDLRLGLWPDGAVGIFNADNYHSPVDTEVLVFTERMDADRPGRRSIKEYA